MAGGLARPLAGQEKELPVSGAGFAVGGGGCSKPRHCGAGGREPRRVCPASRSSWSANHYRVCNRERTRTTSEQTDDPTRRPCSLDPPSKVSPSLSIGKFIDDRGGNPENEVSGSRMSRSCHRAFLKSTAHTEWMSSRENGTLPPWIPLKSIAADNAKSLGISSV